MCEILEADTVYVKFSHQTPQNNVQDWLGPALYMT